MLDARLARVRHEIARRAYAGLDARALRAEVLPLLRKVLAADAVWWALADPDTLLFTQAISDVSRAATPLFLENELLQQDVNKFARLARAAVPVSTLYDATDGRLEQSQRFRDILRPHRMGDELRVALRDSRHCWGFVCLHREAGAPRFSRDEQAWMRAVAPHLAAGLRHALLQGECARADAPFQSGVLIVTPALDVVSVSASAEGMLADIDDGVPAGAHVLPVATAVARLLAIERANDVGEPLPQIRVRGRSGRWVTVSASRMHPADRDNIAVMLEPARTERIVPLLFAASGLTGSETRVAGYVLRGFSNKEIAAALAIAPLTVQQHLKGVFEKTRVHSRGELLARLHRLSGTR